MGWWEDLTKPWSDFWDSVSGNDQRRALEGAQQQNLQTAQTQLDYQKAAMEEYLKYMREALKQQGQSTNDAIAMQLLGAQLGDTTARENALPYQAASLSALQALPVLQSMAGLPAYKLPTSMNASVPDYLRAYINAKRAMDAAVNPPPATEVWHDTTKNEYVNMQWDPAQNKWVETSRTPATSQPTVPDGIRVNVRSYPTTPPTVPPPSPSGEIPASWKPAVDLVPGGKYNLEKFTPEYNFQASPLYDWQKGENTRTLRQGLSARGLLSSGAGAELENRMLSQLSANESQNQYNRVMDIAKIGLGQAASAGNWQNQASTPINLGNQVAGDLNAAAQNRSSMYQGMAGAAQGMYGNMGNIMGQAYGANNALSQQMASMPSPWMNALGTGLKLYGMYSGGSPFAFGMSDIFSGG